jgi:hypothetical protein
MATTCFGLRLSSGSLQLSLAKVILILNHSARLHRNLLCGGVAACPGMARVLCAVQSETYSRSAQNKGPIPQELLISNNTHFRITWTNKMHYFLWIYFNNKPLHVSNRLGSHHQEDQLCINSNWYSQHNAWLYQLLFIKSWSSWRWAASLLGTCRA